MRRRVEDPAERGVVEESDRETTGGGRQEAMGPLGCFTGGFHGGLGLRERLWAWQAGPYVVSAGLPAGPGHGPKYFFFHLPSKSNLRFESTSRNSENARIFYPSSERNWVIYLLMF